MPQAMRVSNVAQYNRSLKNRGKVFKMMHKILTKYIGNIGHLGRNEKYGNDLIILMHKVSYMLHLSLRQACGFFEDYVEQHNLKLDIPDYTTLSKRLQKLSLVINNKNSHAIDLSVDSTTMSIYNNTGTHSKENGRKRKYEHYEQTRKLHIGVDIKTKSACGIHYSHGTLTDHQGFLFVIDNISSKISSVRADRAYDRKPCYERSITPIIPPIRKAAIKTDKIFKQRNQAINYIRAYESYDFGITEWGKQKKYGKRSHSEAFFSRFKSIFGFSLKNKDEISRKNEAVIKCIILNSFNRLGTAKFELV